MMKWIKCVLARLGEWMDDLLFPQHVLCLCCDHALDDEAADGVCKSCSRKLERLAIAQEALEAREDRLLPEGIDYIHAAYVYEGPARKLIHRLKYESVRAAAVPLAAQMALLPSGEEEIIVPVPTDRKRRRRRGFNQSSLLAQHIADTLGMEMKEALVRVDTRRPQTGLSARERRENLVGCMMASDAVSGKRVLLVDDVCTTGATVQEAARALREAGAKSVGVFTAARSSGDSDGEKDPFAMLPRQ
ncbi:MAG: ComF family protein [Clostridiales bacterium]|nr:ComF family protein [Clostridiales bacterium]